MATTTVLFSPRRVNAGTFGPSTPLDFAADPQERTVVLEVLSDDWTTNEVGLEVDLLLEESTDAGQTWVTKVIGHVLGGAVSARTGNLPSVSVGLPAGLAVQLRGTATLNQRANSIGLALTILP